MLQRVTKRAEIVRQGVGNTRTADNITRVLIRCFVNPLVFVLRTRSKRCCRTVRGLHSRDVTLAGCDGKRRVQQAFLRAAKLISLVRI